MKKIVSLLLAVSLAATLLAGCSKPAPAAAEGAATPAPTTAPATETASTPAPDASSGNVSVTAPAGWTKKEDAVVPTYMNKTCSFIVSKDMVPSEAASLDDYVVFTKKLLGDTFKDAKFKEPEKVTIAGKEARKMEFTVDMGGMKMDYAIYYLINNGTAYSFTCAGLTAEFAAAQKDYQAFLDSVKFE